MNPSQQLKGRLRLKKLEPWLVAGCVLVVVAAAVPTSLAGCIWLGRTVYAQVEARQPDKGTKKTESPSQGEKIAGKTGEAPGGGANQQTAATKEELNQLLAAAEKESKERIDKELERSKMLLDGLVTLMGIYSVLLGLTAFVTVKLSRDDAKEQLKEYKEKLDAIGASFPQFERMDERIQRLLHEIKQLMPSEDDWNDPALFSKIDEVNRQAMLDSETLVAAASVFALDRSPSLRITLFSIYTNFARFHDARFWSSPVNDEAEFARAVHFADIAIKMDPSGAAGYRQRGAIRLDGYRKLEGVTKPEEIATRNKRLEQGEADLDEALRSYRSGAPDAGAYYNRALAYYYRGNMQSAIDTSEELLAMEDKISREPRERFLPYVYSNLGGYYASIAIAATKAGQAPRATDFSEKAVKAVERGVKDLGKPEGSGKALERLKAQVQSELDANQELNQLDVQYVNRLKGLL